MKRNKLASLILLAVASQSVVAGELNVTLSKKQVYTGDSVRAESVLDENAQTVSYIWVNENNEILERGPVFRLNDELASQSTTIRVCERQVLNDGEVLNGCSPSIEVNPKLYTGVDLKLNNRPVVSNVQVVGFPFIGNTVNVEYDYFDGDDDPENKDAAEIAWIYRGPNSGDNDWKPIPGGGRDLLIPEKLDDGTVLEVGGLLKVVVSATSDAGSSGGTTSDRTPSEEYEIQTNYPGGNIADNYFRPLLTSETKTVESVSETYRTGPDGDPDTATSEDGYDFALLTQEQAVEECEYREMQLVVDADAFTNYMNENSADGGLVAKWPKNKMFWTNDLDEDDIFRDFFGVAFADASKAFEATAASPQGVGLIVCEKPDEE